MAKLVSSHMHLVTLQDSFWTWLKGDGQEILSRNSVSEANVAIALSEWDVLEKNELVKLRNRHGKIRSEFEEQGKEVSGEEFVAKHYNSRKLRRIYYREDQPRKRPTELRMSSKRSFATASQIPDSQKLTWLPRYVPD